MFGHTIPTNFFEVNPPLGMKHLIIMTKEVQIVILMNLWHLDNTTNFSFPKHVILKR